VYEQNVLNTDLTQRYTRHSLVKKYFDGETKEERKTRKSLDKVQKSAEDVQILPQKSVDTNYILCLKHGTKYSADYVNTLYNMTRRHCTVDYTFVCLTEDATNLDPNILIVPLPNNLQGWWCKPYMFSNELGLNGTILYLDLDIVIASNIDHLFSFEPNRWCTIRDFTRKQRPSWQKYNSSVVRFKTGQLTNVWEKFKTNNKEIERKYHGDQDWLYFVTSTSNPAALFPDTWIKSWKWEIRQSRDLKSGGERGNRVLRTVEHITPPKECCITVFHGDPNPHNCKDPWVVDNWR
jgi:hypothetical protein